LDVDGFGCRQRFLLSRAGGGVSRRSSRFTGIDRPRPTASETRACGPQLTGQATRRPGEPLFGSECP
jgi:hypothetical protein